MLEWIILGARRCLRFSLPVLALAAVAAHAEVALAPVFTDGAVLQRDKAIPVWGTARPGEVVTVTFGAETQQALAGPDGRWIALLQPREANAAGSDLGVAGKDNTIVLHDVVVGEVWLCSGQSNMEFRVAEAAHADREIAGANFVGIRHLRIENQSTAQPAQRVATSGWKTATPANVREFTAVGYFFARDLHERLGVPVGIIHASWGGTPIEAWMSPFAVDSDPAFRVIRDRWAEQVARYPKLKEEYEARAAAWQAGLAAATARGSKPLAEWRRLNPEPYPPGGGEGDPWTPTGLFNGMIHPTVPYALRGILWYQGESNAGRASEYHALFAAMIKAWRAHFAQGDIPFYWVNLANWRADDPTDTSWAFLREAQTKTLALPNTGQALAIDIGDPKDIHPRNKQEVGRRLALLAKRRVYDLVADDTGPTFAGATREGANLRVRFTHVSGGLVAHNKPPQALEVAGADRVFHPAAGRIERDTLLVGSVHVKEPVAVRYAWRNSPEANLYGGTGLPVVPFRSDAW